MIYTVNKFVKFLSGNSNMELWTNFNAVSMFMCSTFVGGLSCPRFWKFPILSNYLNVVKNRKVCFGCQVLTFLSLHLALKRRIPAYDSAADNRYSNLGVQWKLVLIALHPNYRTNDNRPSSAERPLQTLIDNFFAQEDLQVAFSPSNMATIPLCQEFSRIIINRESVLKLPTALLFSPKRPIRINLFLWIFYYFVMSSLPTFFIFSWHLVIKKYPTYVGICLICSLHMTVILFNVGGLSFWHTNEFAK